MFDQGSEQVAIYRAPALPEIRERSLVLQAVGLAHEIRRQEDEYVLLVASADVARGQAELDAYARENVERPSLSILVYPHVDGGGAVLAYGIVLLLVGVLAQRDAWGWDWLAAGRVHAGLILDGQWWRTVTALTLHADFAHLFANLVLGGTFGFFAGRSLGPGAAWLSILLAGAVGNLLNACMRETGHTSIGASTAVFGALGLLTAEAWRLRRQQSSRMQRWVPIVGGVVLLSFVGTGGERTDVAAHVFGFAGGLVLGVCIGRWGREFLSRPQRQPLLGLAALLLVGLAWFIAGAAYRNTGS